MTEIEAKDLFDCKESYLGKKTITFPQNDNVNHPAHYTAGSVECIDAIEAAVQGLDGFEGYCVGNAIKYLWRWKRKGGKTDVSKAAWYVNRLSERLNKEDANV